MAACSPRAARSAAPSRRDSSSSAADDEFNAAVQRIREGDEDAFRQVHRAVQPGLLRYLTVLVGTGDADDVASETWAQAVRDLHRFSGDGDGFRGWVSTIGRHRALDHLRAKGRRPVLDLPVEDLPERAGGCDAEAGALESLSTRAALALIASLPPDQAEAVLLRAVLGLDARSAARVLGKRPGAVRTAAYRGLRALADRAERAPYRPAPDGGDEPGCDVSPSLNAEEAR